MSSPPSPGRRRPHWLDILLIVLVFLGSLVELFNRTNRKGPPS